MIIFRKNLMEECNGPEPEKFPEDHHIYNKSNHKDTEDSEKPHSPKSHFNKVYKRSQVIYQESPA
jgi:hypothetical protein